MASAKTRVDQLLVERGLVESLAKAQALVMAGLVFTGEQRLESAGEKVDPALAITVRGQELPWVSRGGLKLAHGLSHFGFDPNGRVCVDIGASTGGFTDVLLTHGAAKVYAVDVGYGQFAHKLRTAPNVVTLERTNARFLDLAQIPEPVGAVVCDASFISLRTVLPASLALTVPGAWLIALIKPQFEASKEHVGKKGVVRDRAVHEEVCQMIVNWLGAQDGWKVAGVTASPITGPEGNIEFLIGATKS